MGIVTIPCAVGDRRAVSFDVVGIYSDRIFLREIWGEWLVYYATLAAAAEDVCRHCHGRFGNKRIIYRDVKDQWRELVHEDGAFKRLAPYGEHIPLKIIGDWLSNISGSG